MKIAYIFSTLATNGGTEKILVEKINYLADIMGHDVTVINCVQHTNEKNVYTVSNKVKQINLGVPYYSQYKYKYPKRLWVKLRLNRQLQKSIKESIQQTDPDIVIGISRYMADKICTLKCKAKKIIECHVVRYNKLSNIGEERSFLSRIYRKYYESHYFKTIERHADVVVTLTAKDKLLWNKAKRVEVIPNFSTMKISKISNCTEKRIIAVGRLERIKGFERLIDIWEIVSRRYPDWYLDIFGDGKLYDTLNNKIKTDKVNNITIHNYTSNISQEYAKSSICAVTSLFEGFSLVLLEALMHGVPCVAFNVPFGPESILEDGKCGYLVEDGNNDAFASKLCSLIENEQLRLQFSKSAIERAKHFDTSAVMKQWELLLHNILA